MKALLFIFSTAMLIVRSGNSENKPDFSDTAPEKDPLKSAVEWSKLQDRNGDAYLPNTDKPYSGWAKQTYDNGKVKVLAEFIDGSVTHLKQWQENGIPKSDIEYLKGKVSLSDVPLEDSWKNFSLHHGLVTYWYANGQKSSERSYKYGKFDGILTKWYENGQKRFVINCKDGKKEGLAILYDENGQKYSEGNYKDGKEDGLHSSWYKKGQKRFEENYKDGKLMYVEVWKPNGEKCPVTNVKEGNGVVIYYNEDGSQMRRMTYKDGEERVRD